YADDFVVCHRDLEVIQRCQQLLQEWLRPLGLELKASKTRIRHTLETREGEAGFDFLGFHVQHFPVGRNHGGKDRWGNRLEFKTVIKPSRPKVQLHTRRLGEIVRRYRAAPQEALIARLNPLIRGWCNYYRTAASRATFTTCDNVLYQQLRRWA